MGPFRDGGELALHERAPGKEAGQEGGAPEEPGEGTDLTPRRKLELPFGIQYPRSGYADLRVFSEEPIQAVEEVPLDDGVRVYEDDDVSRRGGDSFVVGAGEADVFSVPDQTHPGW